MGVEGRPATAPQDDGILLHRSRFGNVAEFYCHEYGYSAHGHQCSWLAEGPHLLQVSPETGRHRRRVSREPDGR
jgi:hypothetical protein